jgi:uncharacterized membrane protein YdfJ with MMPL/SSD domain
MGIRMDYNVFILTRIREEVHKGKALNRHSRCGRLDGGIYYRPGIDLGARSAL